jgi:hypothetical protein
VTLPSNAANNSNLEIGVHVLAADTVVDPVWDTVGTDALFDDGGSMAMAPTAAERIGLAVGNLGEMGFSGPGGVNLDYELSGEECGTRDPRDYEYLVSGTPYTLIASESGLVPSSVNLTLSYNDIINQRELDGWDPAVSPNTVPADEVPISGLAADNTYDSVYVGKFVNRDTSVAWEWTFYAPRDPDNNPANDVDEYIVVGSKIYSGDGQSHEHLTIGHNVDWDIPADSLPYNRADVSSEGFTYVQGYDTSGHEDPTCLNSTRYGTEAFVVMWTNDICANTTDGYYGSVALDQLLQTDTNFARDLTPISPPKPDGKAWWEDIQSHPGNGRDQTLNEYHDYAVWTTFQHDFTLNAEDTIWVYTVLSSVRDGALGDLETNVEHGRNWVLNTHLDFSGCSCCEGQTGDANKLDGDIPTVGDIADIIDQLFGTGKIVECVDEGDADLSRFDDTPDPGDKAVPADISVSDIGGIIDQLFGTGKILPDCP